ncbi:hypothetical protein [Kitasatospora sp. NPDC001527]|uniref:hypothetical protein n=1 Tax=Kitasatospora sp. NPDC001527 TaxID=3154519 RepID=UPI0033272053
MEDLGTEWRLLSQEADLSAQSIGIGLTYMRKSNRGEPGLYYGAFFNYTIGLERLMKLTLLISHRVNFGAFPESAGFKKEYGHDLRKLLNAVQGARFVMEQGRFRWEFPASPLVGVIMEILADFAQYDRYHGLDVLTGSPKAKPIDPIARWFSEVGMPLLAERPVRHNSKNERDVDFINEMLRRDAAYVVAFSEMGDRLSTLGDVFRGDRDSEYVAKRATFLCAAIVRYVVETLYLLNEDARAKGVELPHFDEFFPAFYNDDEYLKSRKAFTRR